MHNITKYCQTWLTCLLKAGFPMNFVCISIICLCINSYAVPLFGLNTFPAWAAANLGNSSMCDTSAATSFVANLSTTTLIGDATAS